MPIAWNKDQTGGETGRKGVEKVSNDGFTVVATKQKPRPAESVNVDPQDDPRQPSESIYHPDFATIRTPSDILFQTGDGVLFWFSLSLLAYHSPKFALIDHETLWLRSKPHESTSVLNILAIDSRTFAFIAHTLLIDYTRRQKALYFEELVIDDLPSAILHDDTAETLGRALKFAKAWGITSFTKMVIPLMSEYAETLLDLQTYAAFETGSQIMRLLGI